MGRAGPLVPRTTRPSGRGRWGLSADAGKPTTLLEAGRRPGLFGAFGVEIEIMIVGREDFGVLPVCDRLMERVVGAPASEAPVGALAWSNELTLHVLEAKTDGPAPALVGLAQSFHETFQRADRELEALGARLLPGAVHPWMDPDTETRLWPHEYTDVYRTYDRIFGCRGHGWANLQSTHLNLPFADDEEFARLHAAVRLILPLIPAIAAGSPYLDGVLQPQMDARLAAYRLNSARVPEVTGAVVPEPVADEAGYERTVLEPIYRALEPHDPDGVLRHEWVNARGAIARFDRGAVEIRVIDAQECPAADLAVLAVVTAAVRALAEGPLADRALEADPPTAQLASMLDACIEHGDQAVIDNADFLAVLGLGGHASSALDVWRRLIERFPPSQYDPLWDAPLDAILSTGPLARRMVASAGPTPSRGDLRALAERMAGCLAANTPLSS